MKTLPILILIGLAAAGCSPAPAATGAAPGNPALSAVIPAPSTGVTSSGLGPLIVTVRPPSVPIEPVQGSEVPPGAVPPQGWRAYTSSALGVTVDVPSAWSATEEAGGVTFTSPQGVTILLNAAGSGDGGQCTLLANAYGQNLQTCFDPALNRYSATLEVTRGDGTTQPVTLSTLGQDALDVYRGMLNLLRPAQ